MAVEILRAALKQSPVQHQTHHDIASVVWVLSYSVIRRCATPPLSLGLNSRQLEDVLGFFRLIYGESSPREILHARTGADPIVLLSCRLSADYLNPNQAISHADVQ